MAQAFRPLLVESKGRITNIGSISGILAGARLNAYSISKHGIEAFTDSLAAELAPQGVIVNVVEPGNFNSEIGASAARRTGVSTAFADRTKFKEPDEVAAAIMLALFEDQPKRRYMVTPDQNEAEYTIRKQIEQLAQLNEDHPYTYSRDDLVKMLDEALAKTRPRK
jgi:NAD(P)-dependent dehydrogenase (short-subunit alcohol dehydrogenase family)